MSEEVRTLLPARPRATEPPRDDGAEAAGDVGFAGRLLLLTALGFATRAAFVLLEPRPELAGDEPTWIAFGIGLTRLRRPFSPFSSPILFYPPGYPYFLGSVYALFGKLEAVKWAQAVLGALLVPAVGRVGRLAFSPRVGLVAAGIAALYPELVFFAGHFWSETLFLTCLWWAFERTLASGRSRGPGAALVAGLLWGLAALTRETAFYFVPLAAGWLLFERRSRQAAALLLAAFLTILPWTLRNWVVFHAVVPISTFGAHALWQGNTRLPIDEFYRQTDSVPGAIPQYRLARTEALRAIGDRQPLWLLEKLAHELPLLWGPETHVSVLLDNEAYGPIRPGTARLARAASVLPYLVILMAALPGLAALEPTRDRLLLLLLLLYHNALHVASYGQDRFRLPAMPVLFLAAAYAATAFRDGAYPSLGRARRALLVGLVLITAAILIPGLLSAAR